MMGFLAQTTQQLSQHQLWVIVGLAATAVIYLAVLRPMMRKQKDPLEKAPSYASLSQQRATERQMQNLLVELSEMARQITAQLDTRAARLEVLIKEADEKIASLGATKHASDSSAPHPVTPPSPPVPQNAEPAPPDPRHADVYALADQGHDAGQIAGELGRPRGEIELILALRTS